MNEKPTFRIRTPEPFGRWYYWPGEHLTINTALSALVKIYDPRAEIVDQTGAVVIYSRVALAVKDGRPS